MDYVEALLVERDLLLGERRWLELLHDHRELHDMHRPDGELQIEERIREVDSRLARVTRDLVDAYRPHIDELAASSAGWFTERFEVLRDVGMLAAVKAVMSYERGRGPFVVWLNRRVRREFLRAIRDFDDPL